jgi:hypothetical protein
MGDDAVLSLARNAVSKAKAIFEHPLPNQIKNLDPHADMTTMSSQQVAQSFQYFTAMHSHMLQSIAELDAEIVALDFQKRVYKDSLVLKYATKSKKFSIDAEISTDQRYQKLAGMVIDRSTRKTALIAAAEGVHGKASCLSRELSRRETERSR